MRDASRFEVEGFEHLQADRSEEAQASFEAGLRANPRDEGCLLGLMRMHALAGDTAGAARFAEKLLAVAPEHREAKSAAAFHRLERDEGRALTTLQQLAEQPGSGVFERVNYAKALLFTGNDAEAAFAHAIAAEPNSPYAYIEAAEAALEQGDAAGAVVRLSEALRLTPNQPGLYIALAEAHEAAGDFARADQALIDASGLAPDDTSLLERRYDLAFEGGRFEDALGIADRLLKVVPKDPEYRFMRGQALARLGKREEARRELQSVALSNPEAAEPLVALAELAYEGENDPDTAISLLQRALKHAPDDIGAANDLANIYLELDEPEKVEAVLRPVLEAHPGEPISTFNLAMALVKSDPQRAAQLAREVVESGHPQLGPEAEKLLAGLK